MSETKYTPAGEPPPGVVPNFDDPPSHQATIIGVCTTLIVLTLVFLGIRLYTSFKISRTRGYENYLCIAATILSFAYMACVMRLSYAARHMWDFPVQWFDDEYWKIRFAQNTIQAFAFFFSRLPIFALYLQLFGKRVGFRRAVYVGLIANFLVYLVVVPFVAHYCTPASGYGWSSPDIFESCKRLIIYAIVQGSSNILLGLYVIILPMPIIWKLQMPLKRRIAVLSVFATGLIAVATSGISLYYRYKLSYEDDVNWNEGVFVTLLSVEINIAIICGCMPACPAFFNHFFSNSKYLTSIGTKVGHLRSRFSSKSSISGSFNNSVPSSETKVRTEIETRETFECVYIPGRGYVPISERNQPDKQPDVRAVCFSGKSDPEA